MRRILLVTLLVFAGGLAVLLWVDRALHEEPVQVETPTPDPTVSPDQGETVQVPDEAGQVTEITLSGPLRLSEVDPDTLVRRYELSARDSRSQASGVVEAEGIVLELFDERGQEFDRRVEADRGQLQVKLGDGRPRIDDGVPIVLEEVTAHLGSGLEFAPLDLAISMVEMLLGERSLRSDRPVEVVGRGLSAWGEGLFADGRDNLMRIEREARVELTLEGGARATLAAAGPLTLADRPDLGPGMAMVQAEGGALLTLEGDEPLEVEAPVVRLFGRILEDPQRFVPLSAEAEDGVELRPRQGRFLGDRAEIEFDEQGLATGGRLLGAPSFELDLRGVDLSGLGPEAPSSPQEALPVVGRGASELILVFGERATFALDGPATVLLPSLDSTLDSQGPIEGSSEEGLGYATIEASGEVEVRSGELELEAPQVGVEALRSQDEELFARLTARGQTTARGPSEDGLRRFTLLAGDGLVATRRGESYTLPRATDVELTVTGQGALRARADELRDLVGETFAFVAFGDVEIDDVRGHGEGERLVSHGLATRGAEHAELFGRPGEPATLTHPQGELSADHIEGEGQRLSAQGSVHATLDVEGFSVDLRSRWLEAGPGTPREGTDQAPDWALDAGGNVRAVVVTPEARHELSSQLLRLEADEELRDGRLRLVPAGLEALGEVDAVYQAEMVIRAQGDRLTYDKAGTGRLEPLLGEQVHVQGELPERAVTFTMRAVELEYGLDQLSATACDIEVLGVDLPLLGEESDEADPRLRAVAGHMLVDRRSLLFSDSVYITRVSGENVSWSLDAERVQLVGAGPEDEDTTETAPGELALSGALRELYAWGGFVASSADGLQLLGQRLQISRTDDRVTALGSPAAVKGRGVRWESEWFELDRTRRSIRAAAGQVRSTVEGTRSWSMRYASLEPEERDDETIQVLREPVLTSGEEELRASWALFWVDPRRWGALEGSAAEPDVTGEQRAQPRMRSLFGELLRFEGIDWLRAVYLEGNVAYTLEGDGKAQAQAVYVDLLDGHSWIRDVSLETRMPFTRDRTPMKVRAEWLRHSADGTYTAVGAVATTCEHEVPHYVIRIGDLRILPRAQPSRRIDPETGKEVTEEEFVGWDIVARENQLRLWRDVGLPLPKIEVPIDEKYSVETEDVSVLGLRPLSFGNDAKFGAFIGTSFSIDLSWLASLFDRLIGGSGETGETGRPGAQAGRANLDARWLNGRGGLLLGVGVPFYSPGRYWIDMAVHGIFDDGEDRGLVRVPQSERDLWRAWYRARGRYLLGEGEWVDLVATFQSDPGFQSEYFEGDYLSFEERVSYLHYRKVDGDRAFTARVDAPVQSWRTQILNQPALTFFDGRSRVASLGALALLYGWRVDAGHFSRQEGSGGYEPPFPDGLGERDVLRFDTRHRLETPIDLSLAGLRATPFVEGRFTAWDEAADPDVQPARAGLLAGAELATTLYRAFQSGGRHSVTPKVGVRTDLATVDDDVALVPIDRTELPLEGTFVDLGLRSRWTHAERLDTLDIELGITHAADVPTGAEDGWLPLRTRGLWFSTLLGIPYVISHDGRYDLDDDLTQYSRLQVAFEPVPPVDIELAHHFGRDPLTQTPLYEAITLGAIWRFSSKWEIEGRQTISNLDDGRLASGFLLRRLGHDFLLEIESRFVAGEGESFGFKFTPLVLWDASGFSLLDRTRSDPW